MSSKDTRVVEMQFNNTNFEKNASKTIDTIGKLNKSMSTLGDPEATKRLEAMSQAIKDLPLDFAQTGIHTFGTGLAKIKNVAIDQTIRNITTELEKLAAQAIKTSNIFSGGMAAGYEEYNTQIGAVQTIWANTKDAGSTMDDIMKSLDELNVYADKTIYNFTEMTRNIGTFTAAGVGLEDATRAIQGIANLAAVSGSTSLQASNAMYQLSQALASGTVKLMDWNSVVNASMGGKLFQNKLTETAAELGVVDEDLAKVIDGTETFRDSLQSGWLTSEVLLKTLDKFTDTTTDFGRDAMDAATKVKTLRDLLSTLKETVQSGWTESWTIIFGNFEEARNMWTRVSNAIQNTIQPATETRNAILKYWATTGEGSDQLEKAAETEKEQTEKMDKVVQDVINGKYGTGQARYEALEKAGFDYKVVQNAVNEMLGMDAAFDIDEQKVEEGNTALTGRQMVVEGLRNVWLSFVNITGAIKSALLESAPDTTDIGKALVNLSKGFFNFTKKIKDSTENLEWLKAIVRGISNTFRAFGEVVSLVFSVVKKFLPSLKPLIGIFGSLLSSITKIITKFFEFIKESKIFEKIFGGLSKLVKGVANSLFGLASRFENFANNIDFSAIFDKVSKSIRNLIEVLFGSNGAENGKSPIESTLEGQADTMEKSVPIIDKIGNAIGKTKETIKSFSEIVGDDLSTAGTKLKDFFNMIIGTFMELDADDFVKISTVLSNGALVLFLRSFSEFGPKLSGAIGEIKATFSILKLSIKGVGDAIKKSYKADATLKLLAGLSLIIISIAGSIYLLSNIPDPMRALEMSAIVAAFFIEFTVIAKVTKEIDMKSLGLAFIGFGVAIGLIALAINSLGRLDEKVLKQGIIAVGIIAILMGGVILAISKIGAVNKEMSAVNLYSVAATFIALAISINALVIPIILFGLLPIKTIGKGLLMVAGAVAVLVGAVALLSNVKQLPKVALAFIGLALAVNLLVAPIILLGAVLALNGDATIEAAILLAAFVLAFAGAMALIVKWLGDDTGKMLTVAGSLLVMVLAIDLLILGISQLAGPSSTTAVLMFAVIVGVLIGAIYALAALPQVFGPGVETMIKYFALFSVAIAAVVFSISLLIKSIMAFATADLTGLSVNLIIMFQSLAQAMPVAMVAIDSFFVGIESLLKKHGLWVIDYLADCLVRIIEILSGLMGQIIDIVISAISDGIVGIVNFLASTGGRIIDVLVGLFAEILDTIAEKLPGMLEDLKVILSGVLEMLMTLFSDLLTDLIGLITTKAPEIINMLVTALTNLVTAIAENIGPILDGIAEIITSILTFIADNLPIWLETVIEGFINTVRTFIVSVINGIADSIGDVLDAVANLIVSAIEGIVEFNERIWGAIISVIDRIADDIDTFGPKLKEALTHLITSILKFFNLDKFMAKGKAMMNSLKSGINSVKDKVLGVVSGIWDGITGVFSGAWETFKNFGKNLIEGLVSGIKSAFSFAGDGVEWIVEHISDLWSKLTGTNSPSRMTMEWGNYLTQGLGIGITKGTKNATKPISTLVDSLENAMDADLQVDPTIRPIMDLSNVNAGVSAINGMFGNRNLGLSDLNTSFTKSINLSSEVHNGSYNDNNVIAQISALRKDINTLGNKMSDIQVVLDTGAMVGAMVGPMDKALGKKQVLRSRGG